jgi:hypothetical protein
VPQVDDIVEHTARLVHVRQIDAKRPAFGERQFDVCANSDGLAVENNLIAVATLEPIMIGNFGRQTDTRLCSDLRPQWQSDYRAGGT